jgi:hypothetical protein
LGPECSNLLSEARLSFTAGVSARIPGHVVHGFTAEIDEVTAEGAKRMEELSIFQRRKG